MASIDPRLVNVALSQAPAIIAMIQGLFKKANPTAKEPTEEEVFAAFELAFSQSVLHDEAWLAAHPVK